MAPTLRQPMFDHRSNEATYPESCMRLRRGRRGAGIPPRLAVPHRLRHYFGLAFAIAGVPTTALMRAMGHITPIMTARYSEFADTERRQAFARADILKGIELPGP